MPYALQKCSLRLKERELSETLRVNSIRTLTSKLCPLIFKQFRRQSIHMYDDLINFTLLKLNYLVYMIKYPFDGFKAVSYLKF